jgi:hypothetical protein
MKGIVDDWQDRHTVSPTITGGGARAALGGSGAPARPAAPGMTRRPRQSWTLVPVPPAANQRPDVALQWPVQDFHRLGATPSVVPSARLHALQVLREWAPRLTERVERVVSGLATNELQASIGLNGIQAPSGARAGSGG